MGTEVASSDLCLRHKFTVDQMVSCLKGGYIHRRHDELCDIFVHVLTSVTHDVSIEPALAPLAGVKLASANISST